MIVTQESFKAGLSELDEEIKKRSDDILSGKIPEGDYKKSVAYIQGIIFAKDRMMDTSDRVANRKKNKTQGEDEDAASD